MNSPMQDYLSSPPDTQPTKGMLPSHLSETTFRRFEPFITEAVNNAPKDTSFLIPKDLAPTTFVARLRDSCLSVKRFGWTTTIDTDKLWSLTGKMIWTYDPTSKLVWYREKQQRGRPLEMTAMAKEKNANGPTIAARWNDTSPAVMGALAILINAGFVRGPIIAEGMVDQTRADSLQESYDVALVYDPIKNETIIT